MKVEITKQIPVKESLKFINKLAGKVSSKFKLSKQTVSLAFISSSEIRKINRIYRGRDQVTDVLSFQYDAAALLGEIIICATQAKQQAKESKISFEDEVSRLFVHGCLHLLGYEHKTNSGSQKMERVATELLGKSHEQI